MNSTNREKLINVYTITYIVSYITNSITITIILIFYFMVTFVNHLSKKAIIYIYTMQMTI
jgi:hypothetical protein